MGFLNVVLLSSSTSSSSSDSTSVASFLLAFLLDFLSFATTTFTSSDCSSASSARASFFFFLSFLSFLSDLCFEVPLTPESARVVPPLDFSAFFRALAALRSSFERSDLSLAIVRVDGVCGLEMKSAGVRRWLQFRDGIMRKVLIWKAPVLLLSDLCFRAICVERYVSR